MIFIIKGIIVMVNDYTAGYPLFPLIMLLSNVLLILDPSNLGVWKIVHPPNPMILNLRGHSSSSRASIAALRAEGPDLTQLMNGVICFRGYPL